MKSIFSRAILGLSVFALFIGLSSLSNFTAHAQTEPRVTLTVAMPAPIDLDPVHVSRFDPHTRDLVENLFVGLTRFDPATQHIEPMLAKEWAVSADGLTWTFELRDDIQWVSVDPATGTVTAVRPVAAGDFVYAIQRACNPLRPSPLTPNLMIVRGCLTVANAFPEVITDLFIAREIGVRATGPTTLEIDLRFPASYFPALLSTPEFRALPREAIAANENWTAAGSILTNGPFALQTWTDTDMTLLQNPFWPDAQSGNLEQVNVSFTSSDAALAAVTSTQADFARLSQDTIAAATTSAPDLLQLAPGTSVTVLGFSFEQPLVAAPEIRRALASAIDRDALLNQLFTSGYQLQTSFTPPGVVAAPEITVPGTDLTAAQNWLGTAGYPDCDGIPERFTFTVRNDDPLWLQFGETVVGQWTATLNCNPALFTLNAVPRTTLIELGHANYDPEQITRPHIWLASWSADYPDANAWLNDALHCRYGYLRVDRPCDEADALLDQATTLDDPAARAELYAQVEEHFFGPNGTFPVIPLFRTDSAWVQQPWLSDVNTYGAARYDLWRLDASAQAAS